MSTTQGTPRIGVRTPRLVLHTRTTTTPATTTAAIRSAVTLLGGAASPCDRRRPSRSHERAPYSATTTAITIQLAVTFSWPLVMSLITFELIGTTPPC